MKTENAIRVLAGTLVLTSLSLAHWANNDWWLLLAVFVSLNLIQSAFTGFCPAENVLRKLGVAQARPAGPPSHPQTAAARTRAESPDPHRT
ncbi:MAG: YgaP family membrane protein [Limisphaerales bacterium]